MTYGSIVKTSASQTRPDNTTAYEVKDVVGESPAANLLFENVAIAGRGFKILSVTLEIDVSAIPTGMDKFMLHLYDTAPTAIADGSAYDLPSGDRAKYLGYITLNTPVDLGATLWSQTDTEFIGKLATGSTSLYGILETVAAYSPTAETVKTITLQVVEV